MTEKLYYINPEQQEFTAEIVESKEIESDYHLALNKTIFYPGGGGQPADKGSIGGYKVKDVYEEGDHIYHVLPAPLTNGREIQGRINWEYRFDMMQQHTGQHLLSAVLKNDYQANTIGFHLTENNLTIDIDKDLSQKQLKKIEAEANQAVYNNKNVRTVFPDKEELSQFDLRKYPSVKENIRLVIIEDMDISPCGGIHLQATGQLGLVKILEAEAYKDGMRLKFACGNRARQDYHFKNELLIDLRQVLSVPEEDIAEEVQRLLQEKEAGEKQIEKLRESIMNLRVQELVNKGKHIGDYTVVRENFEEKKYENVQLLAKKIIEADNKIVIMGQREEETARLLLGRSDNIDFLDMNTLIKKPLHLIQGNGGGTQELSQGGGSNSSALPTALEKAEDMIKSKIIAQAD